MDKLSGPSLQATFGLDPEAILHLTEPYCRLLSQDGYEPFFHLLLELLPAMPATVQPQAVQLARTILIDKAFDQLGHLEDLKGTLVSLLEEMPDSIGQALARDMQMNAAQTWNIMIPQVLKMIVEQMEPQRRLIEAAYGVEEDHWLRMPPGPERLSAALQSCRKRASEYQDERGDMVAWAAAWIEELIWSWETLMETVKGERDLFASTQIHLLTRVLRSLYQPKCPSPCLPMGERLRRTVFLPLYAEGQKAQEALDKFLRERLEAAPIVPVAGSLFVGERHDAPAVFWRPSRTAAEKANTIYEVREVGLERHGRTLIKATVGLVQSDFETSGTSKPAENVQSVLSTMPPEATLAPEATIKPPEASLPPEANSVNTDTSAADLSEIRMPE